MDVVAEVFVAAGILVAAIYASAGPLTPIAIETHYAKTVPSSIHNRAAFATFNNRGRTSAL